MAHAAVTARQLLFAVLLVTVASACEATDAPPAQLNPLPASASPPATPAPTAPRPTLGPLTIRVDPLNGVSDSQAAPGAYRYHVEVPQLVGLPPRDAAIDTLIRSRLQRVVDDFLDIAQNAPPGPAGSDLTCTNRTVRLTGRLVVLRVDCSEYQAGSAHANTMTQTFNCDVAGGRILALQDLFGSGSGYLDVLATAARTQLRARLGSAEEATLVNGTEPTVDHYKAFLMDRAGLVIVFDKYQVAPGTAGQPEISVTYDDVQRYLDPTVTALLTGG
jgi:hypothetical protein